MIRSNNKDLELKWLHDNGHGFPRRNFLKGVLGATAATVVMPYLNCRSAPVDTYETFKASAAAMSLTDYGDEQFWLKIKEQFPIRENLIMMNAANLCPAPIPVQKTLFDLTKDEDMDASSFNRRKFGAMREDARTGLAEFLGVDPDEIAITRNTSESNNMVINGILLHENDEVVIWDQNHPTNNVAWDVRAERYGFKVIKISTPPEPENYEQLIKPFRDALSRNTKVLAFSHVSNVTGVALPAKDLCRMASENDILTLVDGAQTFGPMAIGLHDIGCDFYTGSADKWFCGPEETGVLYVKRDRIENLFPTIVGIGWESALENGARKFETLGQRDDARVAAFGTSVEFNAAIRPHRIEERVRSLAQTLKEELKKALPNVKFVTPVERELSLGVVIFSSPEIDMDNASRNLYEKHNIGCAVFRGANGGIRLSPNIYNSMEEVDRVVTAVKSLA